MILHQLENRSGARHRAKRKGRGPGSSWGKTAGRGQKGQYARSTVNRHFEGGQTPIHRRLPRRGFKNFSKKQFHIVNLRDLTKLKGLADKDALGPEELAAGGAIRNTTLPVRVLGSGEIKRAVTVQAHYFSKSAREKIEAAGGKTVLIEG
jgi:large subunit ribosomal protein L15